MASKKKQIVSSVRKLGKRGDIDVSVLLSEGVVASLSIGRWRAQQRLLPEDLGFEKEDTSLMQQYMSLGKKTLIPPEMQRKLNAIENSARYALKRYSLDTPFGFFVTAKAYPHLDSEMRRFEAQWYEQRDILVKTMRAKLSEVRKAYGEVAKLVYEKCGRDKARRYAKRIVQGIPLPAQVEASFHFGFQVFYVPMPVLMNQQIREKLVEEEGEKEKLKTIRSHEEHVREMNQLIARMYAEKKEKQVDQFLDSVNKQVRSMVHMVVDSALKSYDKNDGIVGKTAGQLRNMIDRFHMMNILNDTEIASEIAKLESELSKKPKDRNEVSIEGSLQKLQDIATDVSLDLLVVGRSARDEMLFGDPEHVEPVGIVTGRRLSAHGLD